MSIHQTPNGTYILRWRDNGRQRSKTFKKAIEAKKFQAKLTLNPDHDPRINEGDLLFRDYADEWLAKYASVRKVKSTLKVDQGDIRKHLLPAFGHMRVRSITPSVLEWFRADLKSQHNLSNKTINNLMSLLGTMLKMAVKWKYLRENPVDEIEQLKVVENEISFWTFEELDRFLSYAKANDPDTYAVVLFAANTGLRRGEIEGLRRDCLDFDRREILVKREYCSHTRTIVERTKGRRARRVPMNKTVFELLKEKRLLPPSYPVFPGVNFHKFANKKMAPITDHLGITRLRFHDLRHTFGSHLAMLGVPLLKIKDLMGHTDIKTTMRYMHLAPGVLEGVTDVLITRSPNKMFSFCSVSEEGGNDGGVRSRERVTI